MFFENNPVALSNTLTARRYEQERANAADALLTINDDSPEHQPSDTITHSPSAEKANRIRHEGLIVIEEEIVDNPRVGVLWYIIYTLKLTGILYITKGLYQLNPGIEVLQITALKAVISVLILLVCLNSNLKYVMYDRVDPDAKGALAFKTVQSTASIFISYNAMKYFTVSTVGVVCSLTPLVACVLAAIILKEKLTCWTVSSIFIVLSCVLMVIFGAPEGEEAEN